MEALWASNLYYLGLCVTWMVRGWLLTQPLVTGLYPWRECVTQAGSNQMWASKSYESPSTPSEEQMWITQWLRHLLEGGHWGGVRTACWPSNWTHTQRLLSLPHPWGVLCLVFHCGDHFQGQPHRHEFEQTLGDDEGQGSLVCCSLQGREEWDITEWRNNSLERHVLLRPSEQYTRMNPHKVSVQPLRFWQWVQRTTLLWLPKTSPACKFPCLPSPPPTSLQQSALSFGVSLPSMWLFPGGSDGKEFTSNEGDPGSIPVLGRSPGEENGYLLQYSGLGNPTDRGAWWATVHGVAELDTTEWLTLSLSHLTFCVGGQFHISHKKIPRFGANATTPQAGQRSPSF